MDRPDPRQAIEEVLKNLTTEEKNELKNCQRNGFIVGGAWGLTVHALRQIAAQHNKIKKPTLGGNVGTFIVNLILGYITYTPICASKAIEPLVRKKMGYNKHESTSTTELPVPLEESTSLQSTLNTDLDSSFSHLSVSYEPNLADNLILEDEEETIKPKFQTTYEDLRRQNRESYRIKNFAAGDIAKTPSQPVKEMAPKYTEPPKRIKTNQYGDPLE